MRRGTIKPTTAFKALAKARRQRAAERKAAAEANDATPQAILDLADEEHVARTDRCKNCGNRRRDQLIAIDSGVPGEVECGRCGHHYRIAAAQTEAAIAAPADHELIEIVANGKCRIDGHIFDLLDVAPGERWDGETGVQLAFGIQDSNCATEIAVTPAAARELARRILEVLDRD